MARALSVKEVDAKKLPTLTLSERWHNMVGEIAPTGVWLIWGKSGSGKSSFVMQLCKELCRHYKGIYNSLEEGISLTLQNNIRTNRMSEVNSRLAFVEESIEELNERMTKRMSPHFYIIDSLQCTGLSPKTYDEFVNIHKKNKLIIFVSQTDGLRPKGRIGDHALFMADEKIWVEGFRAQTFGRFIGPEETFVIWPERAQAYWGAQAKADLTIK
ncbi:hypothetical protein [Paramuribaculum intestinale]|uniref:hypothetical protein n=1 Tax=Paramuribaculum intestinale TaxID=2094151 RepID=UPI0025B6B98D|nr:hypothetical protein [Paramuribaculum intestinale]